MHEKGYTVWRERAQYAREKLETMRDSIHSSLHMAISAVNNVFNASDISEDIMSGDQESGLQTPKTPKADEESSADDDKKKRKDKKNDKKQKEQQSPMSPKPMSPKPMSPKPMSPKPIPPNSSFEIFCCM